MKRSLKTRVLVTLTATLVAAACGALAGYGIGREITLRVAANGLARDAARAIAESDMFARDAHAVLDAMNASRYVYCSEEDMELLRGLLYRSYLLKDVGRIRDNRIVCSATLGREHLPGAELPKPASIGTDGVKVHMNLPGLQLPAAYVVTLQAGDSYVVLYPYIDSLRELFPAYVTALRTVVSAPPPEGGSARLPWPLLTSNSDFRIGEILYSTRCSPLSIDNICTTTSVSVSSALRADRFRFYGYILFGGMAGGWLGLLLSLAYRRSWSMEQQLRRAIHRDQLQVAYQPIVNMASGRIVGAEALARWTNREGVPVGPDIFIKVAEEHGFVGEITRLVVRRVPREFGPALREHPDLSVSINVAAADFGDPGFLPMLEQSLGQAGIPAERLTIEITERTTAHYKEALETIHQLRLCGHCVHIDDFGTGYSSLSYLQDLDVDAIKIDKSFTRAIGTEAVTLAILPQILAMAEALNLEVVVEGIETSLQADYFATYHRPILAQGWFFGHPVFAEEFHRLLAEDAKTVQAATVEA
jgi:sensor c-di-GMP phosphodiesterase-like protein